MIRDVKFVRLVLVICVILCVTAAGRTKAESGPISVGLGSFAVFGFLLIAAAGVFGCEDPGIGMRLPKPLIGIRDWLSWKEKK